MNDITKCFFIEIGISKGMTVLDVGCGKGVTTELIAEIVGENGKVIGLDSNQNSINKASFKAKTNGLNNIEYICSDISNLSFDENTFDAILGRRVLVYLPKPKNIILNLSKLLKPNGILGFQEHDSTTFIDEEKMPLHFKVNNWLWELVESNGGNIKIGKDILDIFSNKYLSIKNIRTEAITQTPFNEVSLVPIVQTLSKLLIAKNIIPEKELENNNLYEKIETEKKKCKSIFIRELIFFVTAKKI